MVHLVHGVVGSWRADRPTHRNFLDVAAFERHLVDVPRNVEAEEAIHDAGREALTIDDATEAGAHAAELARAHGHEVTLFVNPYNVEHAEPYFFALLNTALEATTLASVSFEGENLDLVDTTRGSRARAVLKRWILEGKDEGERTERARRVADRLMCGRSPEMPSHVATLSIQRLKELLALGVRIANHGWTHCDWRRLDEDACRAEVEKGRDWLRQVLGVDAGLFAVPFGDVLPPWKTSRAYSWFLLATKTLHYGPVGKQVANRHFLGA